MDWFVIGLSIVLWTCTVFVSFELYILISYLQSKPPGNQTLLDRFFIDAFRLWTIVITTTVFFNSVELNKCLTPDLIAFIAANMFRVLLNGLFIWMTLLAIVNGLMIFNPETINNVLEDKVLQASRGFSGSGINSIDGIGSLPGPNTIGVLQHDSKTNHGGQPPSLWTLFCLEWCWLLSQPWRYHSSSRRGFWVRVKPICSLWSCSLPTACYGFYSSSFSNVCNRTRKTTLDISLPLFHQCFSFFFMIWGKPTIKKFIDRKITSIVYNTELSFKEAYKSVAFSRTNSVAVQQDVEMNVM